jgi:general L-amino acid transport system substrate-binding protein
VGNGPKGYSTVDAEGVWSGISVDFCRALAVAVLGNKDAVKFRPVLETERFSALLDGEIDVLSRNVAMTSSHDTALGIRFPGVLVFDGQGFMVRKSQGVASALELSGARICVMGETADAQGVGDYFSALRMPFELSSSTSGRMPLTLTPTRARCFPPTSPRWGSRVSSLPIRAST